MQILPVATVPSCLCPCPGSGASQNALLGGQRAPHVPSKETSQSRCGEWGLRGRGGRLDGGPTAGHLGEPQF